MTPAQFRRIALSMPDAVESSHMGTADFRVGGKIFATLGNPNAAWGVVALTPDQQALLIETTPGAFEPAAGAWGKRGWTRVRLAAADAATLKSALTMAWEAKAPKALLRRGNENAAPRAASKPTAKAASSSMDRAFARVKKAAKASKLPGIEEGTSYGTPSLKVAGKFMMRMKDADTYVFHCTMEEKTFLMEAEPAIYFETDHYAGWPVLLVRAAAAGDDELSHCIARAWRSQAPKKLMAGLSGPATKTKPRKRAR